ncbi:hypothetical protein [Marinobacter sp. CHS3-4]|uniref:hypothetical protein n=1 Tax=Marinobacter sp. CHS3-4 TaxID=3045174 RepID=UPI0024B58C6D|nr:hypothetical protein [Marinobacter sp. CHS3-4]MDI9244197.1 hypothetical protein [Marinobacter sp. CHS3-4]
MLELALFAALFFILLAVIASYLLKAAINKHGIAESSVERTTLIAIGMPPISSVKAKFILPGAVLPGQEKLGTAGKAYLAVIRVSFFLAVLSIVVGTVFEFGVNA